MLVCTRYISVQCSTCRYGTIASMYMACTEYIPVCTRYIHSVRIPDEVQAQLCLLFASFASFAPPPRPAWQGLASQWRQWAGPLPARHCTRRILCPAAIHVVMPTTFTLYPEKGPELSELFDSMRHFVKRSMNLQINEPPNPLPGSRS